MITLWHNPRCSKSREALALIEASGTEVTVRHYLEDVPSADEIKIARAALGNPPIIEMVRTDERMFKEAGLSKASPDADLIDAMAAHPILIERPIAFKGTRAIIGRPPEAIRDLL